MKLTNLRQHDYIGIFSPSYPAHILLRDKYLLGISQLSKLGFNVVEGNISQNVDEILTSPKDRADEINLLFEDIRVKAIISNMGGYNSGSILPYIDYELIKRNPKWIIGYSDITTIHCAIKNKVGIPTIYGPCITPSFGEYVKYNKNKYTFDSLKIQTGVAAKSVPFEWDFPKFYTNDIIDANRKEWIYAKKKYINNEGWFVLHKGFTRSKLFACNQNTLLSLVGTEYMPDLSNHILCLEQMNTSIYLEERQLNQLAALGIFRKIKGLIISKPEIIQDTLYKKHFPQLLLDFVSPRKGFPILINFDSGHTHPMLSLTQSVKYVLDCNCEVPKFSQLEWGYKKIV